MPQQRGLLAGRGQRRPGREDMTGKGRCLARQAQHDLDKRVPVPGHAQMPERAVMDPVIGIDQRPEWKQRPRQQAAPAQTALIHGAGQPAIAVLIGVAEHGLGIGETGRGKGVRVCLFDRLDPVEPAGRLFGGREDASGAVAGIAGGCAVCAMHGVPAQQIGDKGVHGIHAGRSHQFQPWLKNCGLGRGSVLEVLVKIRGSTLFGAWGLQGLDQQPVKLHVDEKAA